MRSWAAALLLGTLGCAGGGDVDEAPRNLLIVSLDTVRRDHLPTYGYPRDTALFLDSFARRSIVFDNAYAQDTNTTPSHASMFTGVYPQVHGSLANTQKIDDDQVTLAEILRREGFRTAGFVSGVTMHRTYSGLDRGFELYDDGFEDLRRDGAIAATRAREWLSRRGPDQRWFLFVHLYDAHGPYLPRGEYAELFTSAEPGPRIPWVPEYQRVPDEAGNVETSLNDYVDRYDAMIRYTDDLLAEVLEAVDLEETVVVVLSDHGETLGERYRQLDHGGQLFDEQIRIPLIMCVPGQPPARRDAIVETVDLLPTILDWLDVAIPGDRPVQGRSFVPVMLGQEDVGRELTFSSATADESRHADRGYRLNPRERLYAVRSAEGKLIVYPGVEDDYLELYDLRSDPGERTDVASREIGRRDAYDGLLSAWLGDERPATVDPDELDPEHLEKLKALGYVD
ncbi:MAG: sulfatase [Acidobacteriota bacterium]|nr:sulfatase [Acidobacteriota bacterium]